MTPRSVVNQIVVEGDTVDEAMARVPIELQTLYGRAVPFTIVAIEQDARDIDDDTGAVRVTAVARP